MKRYFSILLLCFFLSTMSFGQRWKLLRYEVFGGVGAINMLTDNGVSNTESFLRGFRIDFTRPAFNIGARYKYTQTYSFKFAVAFGYGYSTDITNDERGFSSRSLLIEPSFQGEYYFLKEEKRFRSAAVYNRRGMVNNYSSFAMYGFLGVGGLYYNAKLNYTPRASDTYKGQGFTLAIPFGIGVKYIYSDKIIIGYELGPRFVFSDYLDGFKTTSSKHNDFYWLTTLYLSYKIKTSRRGLPLFLDRRWKRIRRR